MDSVGGWTGGAVVACCVCSCLQPVASLLRCTHPCFLCSQLYSHKLLAWQGSVTVDALMWLWGLLVSRLGQAGWLTVCWPLSASFVGLQRFSLVVTVFIPGSSPQVVVWWFQLCSCVCTRSTRQNRLVLLLDPAGQRHGWPSPACRLCFSLSWFLLATNVFLPAVLYMSSHLFKACTCCCAASQSTKQGCE